jgi:magnesium transporter
MRRGQERVCDHLSAAFATARCDEPVGGIVDRLEKAGGPVELVCAVDSHGVPLGSLSVGQLFAHPRSTPFGRAMRGDVPVVRLHDDQERAASHALHHGVDALAVVDDTGRLAGIMPAQALLQVLRREHIEDMHRVAGIQREAARARHAIEDPPLRRVEHRLPWLVAGLAGSAVATAVMAAYERRLAANVAIAFFVPAIVYLADAVGTQTEAIAVRGLSLTRRGIGHLLAGELRVGTLLGAALGALALLPIWAGFGDLRLAAAVSTGIWAACTIAACLGLLFPWSLARIGVDPAYGSGPAATVVQDVVSILAYFAVLTLFGV